MHSASGFHGPRGGVGHGGFARWQTAQEALTHECARTAQVRERVRELCAAVSLKEIPFIELQMLSKDELQQLLLSSASDVQAPSGGPTATIAEVMIGTIHKTLEASRGGCCAALQLCAQRSKASMNASAHARDGSTHEGQRSHVRSGAATMHRRPEQQRLAELRLELHARRVQVQVPAQ